MRKITPEEFKAFIDKKQFSDIYLTSSNFPKTIWDIEPYTDNTILFTLHFNSIEIILPKSNESKNNDLNIGSPFMALKNDNNESIYIYRIKEVKYIKTTFEYEFIIVCEKVNHNKDITYRLVIY